MHFTWIIVICLLLSGFCSLWIVAFPTNDDWLSSSASTASSINDYSKHNMWNPPLESLFLEQATGIVKLFLAEIDVAKIALSCQFSEKSKELISGMSNTEYFKLCEISSKIQGLGFTLNSGKRAWVTAPAANACRRQKGIYSWTREDTTSCQSLATLSTIILHTEFDMEKLMRQCMYCKAHEMLKKARKHKKRRLRKRSGQMA